MSVVSRARESASLEPVELVADGLLDRAAPIRELALGDKAVDTLQETALEAYRPPCRPTQVPESGPRDPRGRPRQARPARARPTRARERQLTYADRTSSEPTIEPINDVHDKHR